MHASSKMTTRISMGTRCIVFVVVFAICFVYAKTPISSLHWTEEDSQLIPVVFIPGNGGSQLEARWTDRSNVAGPGCSHSADWHRFWLDIWHFATTSSLRCWSEVFRLHFDPVTETNRNAPGVEVRVPGWGDTHVVEMIDPSWSAWIIGNRGSYAQPLIEGLVSMGYKRGDTVLAAPYDFRFAPHSQSQYYLRLTKLIEEMFHKKKKKVALVAHSMGGNVVHYLLKHKPSLWKETYIDSFITMNTAWKGASSVVQMYISGYNWSAPVDPLIMREKQRHHESSALLLPKEGAWGLNDVIIITPERNYTLANFDQLFKDMDFPVGEKMRQIYTRPDYEFTHPGVPFYCMYSHGLPTAETFIYGEDLKFTGMPLGTIMGDGDGTVNLQSLSPCSKLESGVTVVLKYKGVTHNGIMAEKQSLGDLNKILIGSQVH